MHSLDYKTTTSQLCEYDPESEKSILRIRGSGSNYLELTEIPAVFNESTVEDAVCASEGYRTFPDCPDFGAINKVLPFMIMPNPKGRSFFYSHTALQRAGTWRMCGYIYDLVLQAWGFTISKFVVNSEPHSTIYVRETVSHYQHIELSTLSEFMGTPCVTVKVRSEAKKRVAGYKKTPAAPDFGAYFKVPPIYTHSSPHIDQYRYSLQSLSARGVGGSFFETYWLLLEKFGFAYSGQETSKTVTFFSFNNFPAGLSVSYSVYDAHVTINVSRFCIEI